MYEETEIHELVARPRLWGVVYRVLMDSAGPFHYRSFAFTERDGASLVEKAIREYLGESNIKELHVAPAGKYDVAVGLLLVSDEITCHCEYFGTSSLGVVDEVNALLPEDNLISVTVINGTDLGSRFGPHR